MKENFTFMKLSVVRCIQIKEKKSGSIREILTPGANDVWVVKGSSGKDVLIPYIEQIVKEVDIKAQKVIITPMEGLLD